MTTTNREEPRPLRLIDHLEELRRRLMVCSATLLATVAVGVMHAGTIIAWLKRPAGRHLPLLAVFTPTEGLSAYLQVGLMAGLILATPVILWQLWGFIRPGLAAHERRYGLLIVVGGTGLFLAGLAFAYWVALPMALTVLLGIGEGTLLPMISVSRYLSFTTTILLVTGAIFELPLVILVLAKLGLVTAQGLSRRWSLAILAMAILAAVMTPTTDAITMLVMMVPMLVLYAASILIVARVRPR